MTAAMVFGFGAGVLMAAGGAVYARQYLLGLTQPNGASWLMWAFGSALMLLAEADLGVPRVVLGPLAVAAIGAMAILARRTFLTGKPLIQGQDYLVLAFNFGIAAWTLLLLAGPVGALGFDEGAELLFVALSATAAVTAAWPTLGSVCLGAGRELPHAWFIWSAAYGLLALTVMAEGLGWHYLIYPLVAQASHLLIGLFALGGAEAPGENLGHESVGS